MTESKNNDELIGPMQPPDFKIVREERISTDLKRNMRNNDLIKQIAFMERGLSTYKSDADICEIFNITPETLSEFKKHYRQQIDSSKDEQKFGKFKLLQVINQSLTLREAMIQADIENDPETAQKFADILKRADKVIPFKQIKELAEILKIVDDSPPPGQSKATININVDPGMRRAQESLEELRKQRTIEAKSDPVPNPDTPVPGTGK